MKRIAAALVALCMCARGQQTPDVNPTFTHFLATASTTALTVQLPATGARPVFFESATVYCATACTVTPTWNGTAATATTLAIVALPPAAALPTATAWSGSNASGGTTGYVWQVPAGSTAVIDLRDYALMGAGSSKNFTLTTSASATIGIQWREQ